MRRPLLAIPAALTLAVVPVVAAAEPADLPLDEPAVVADIGDNAFVWGLEVARRTITWGAVSGGVLEPTEDEEPPPLRIAGRSYTPDLGATPLALGGAYTPPVADAMYAVTTDRWSVGFDPFASETGFAVLIKPAGGAVEVIDVPMSFDADAGALAVWGDTAVLGNQIINLNTREVTVLGDRLVFSQPAGLVDVPDVAPCLDAYGAALADGVLVLRDVCEDAVVAVDVSESGFVTSDLDSARTVVEGDADVLALSRGLLVWSERGEDGSHVGWVRLDDEGPVPPEITLDDPVVSLRAHGERFVVVSFTQDGPVAEVYETATAGAGPVATVHVSASLLLRSERADGLARAADPTADMNLFPVPVDLYGRTLAWLGDGEILATTLPALPGEDVRLDAPSTATPGTAITVVGTGFLPGEEIAVWLESEPQLVAQGFAGADGAVSLTLTLPTGIDLGAHTLTMVGVESGWTVAQGITLAVADDGAGGDDGADDGEEDAGQNPGLEVRTGR